MAQDTTVLAGLMKRWYPNQKVEVAGYDGHPVMDVLPKRTDVVGASMQVMIPYSSSNSPSADLATSFGISEVASETQFPVTLADKFNRATISRKALKLCGNDDGAYARLVKESVRRARARWNDDLAIDLFRSGTGTIGQIKASSGVTTTVELNDPADAINFQIGDNIQLAATDGGSVRDTGNAAAITGLDKKLGILTFTNLGSSISGAAAGDYIVRKGNSNLAVKGFLSWLDSSAASLFGITRTTAPTDLAGIHLDGSGENIRDILHQACNEVNRIGGGSCDLLVMNPIRWTQLADSLHSQAVFNSPLKKGEVGFNMVSVNALGGECKVVVDRFCPKNKILVLDRNTWELASSGGLPEIHDEDGNMWSRVANADNLEMRLGAYFQLVCYAPGRNAVISL